MEPAGAVRHGRSAKRLMRGRSRSINGATWPANPRKAGSFELNPGKEMGQHPWGRTPSRRHRRARRLQTGAASLPRRLRRLLRKRSSHQERAGKEMDRHYPREAGKPHRSGAVTENIRSDEVKSDFAWSGERSLPACWFRLPAETPLFG